ncbi:hypothetical protein C2S51_012457 [Perilla frutescens var. frutescens]|nr:hypothetical protein C2S51_012457 [Perilla frutescens var. frutescens]
MDRGKGKGILIEEDVSDSSDEDVDFTADDDSCDELLDDIIFSENIDRDVEWVGGLDDDEEADTSDSEDGEALDGSDFDSADSGEEEGETNVRGVRGSRARVPALQLGQVFSTKNDFKDTVTGQAVVEGRAIKFTKNDTRRVYARCKKAEEGCDWHNNALKVKDEAFFQIKELHLTHTCARQFHGTNAKSGWLAKKFERNFMCDPKLSVKSFRKAAIAELGVYVSP